MVLTWLEYNVLESQASDLKEYWGKIPNAWQFGS
jgi:hypothetical protein